MLRKNAEHFLLSFIQLSAHFNLLTPLEIIIFVSK